MEIYIAIDIKIRQDTFNFFAFFFVIYEALIVREGWMKLVYFVELKSVDWNEWVFETVKAYSYQVTPPICSY